EAAVEDGEVIRVDLPPVLLVTAHRVVAHVETPALEHRLLNEHHVLGRRRLQLGPDGAHADAFAHLIEELPRVAAQYAADLVEGGRDRGAQGLGPSRAHEIAAHQKRRRLGQRQLDWQAERELLLKLPERATSIAALVVVKGKARLLEHAEVAPDRADGAAELPRGIIHGDARRALNHLKKLPLPSELVPARH